MNQVELNFWNPQPELLKVNKPHICALLAHDIIYSHLQWAKENDLLLEAYSPLGSNNQVKETLSVPEVKAIAKELGITPAQAVISWHVQRGVSIRPSTFIATHILTSDL